MLPEKRLVDCLSVYWERLKKEDTLPKMQKINGAAISEVWPHCFLLEIEGDRKSPTFLYQYIGEEIKDAYGKDLTGMHVRQYVNNVPGCAVLDKIDLCIDDKLIHQEYGAFFNTKNKTIKFRSCILPFCSGSKEEVTHILVGLSWRAF